MKKVINDYEIFLRGDEIASHRVPAFSINEAKMLFKKLNGYVRMPYDTYFRIWDRCPHSKERLLEKTIMFLNEIGM